MSREIKVLVANMDAMYGLLSGRDESVTYTLTMPQVLVTLGLSLGGFFARLMSDPLFTAQVSTADIALVASIWLVWLASVSLVLVLTQLGGQGGATVIGLCLAATAVSLVDVLTPNFLLPVESFVLIQLGLALFGLAFAFRLVPQILPGGKAARWSDLFGTVALPACALALFVAVTPMAPLIQSAGAYLAERRAAVEAGRVASSASPDLRQAIEMRATSVAPATVLQNAAPDAGAPVPQLSTASDHPDARAALAIMFLAVGSSGSAAQAASW